MLVLTVIGKVDSENYCIPVFKADLFTTAVLLIVAGRFEWHVHIRVLFTPFSACPHLRPFHSLSKWFLTEWTGTD